MNHGVVPSSIALRVTTVARRDGGDSATSSGKNMPARSVWELRGVLRPLYKLKSSIIVPFTGYTLLVVSSDMTERKQFKQGDATHLSTYITVLRIGREMRSESVALRCYISL